MNGSFKLKDLVAAVKDGHVDTVLVCFPDMFGRLIGKRFQADFFVESGHKETHACDYLLADDIDMEPVPGYEKANWAAGYGDFVLKPDLSTLRVIPWLEATALVLCDVQDHAHQALPHSPRAVLRKQLSRLREHGLAAVTASELEFYLFDEDYRDAYEKGYRNLKTSGYYIEDYHIFQTSKHEDLLRAMRNGLQGAGIPVENSKGEWGPGQQELNIRYADALTMADRHVIMKNGMKEIAHQHGKAITFMSKFDYELAGSSCHIHLSLRDIEHDKPLFHDGQAERGMSVTMKHFMAGLLSHAREITYFLAPYINSYKRFQVGTFAPTRAVWSNDNRTAGFRVCGEHTQSIRCECRIGGADLNPYLAFAALIAAGLDGIENELPLEAEFVGDAYQDDALREIPKTLRAATKELDRSNLLRAALGDDVVDHYVHTAQWEQFEYDRRVTDWERWRGFERA